MGEGTTIRATFRPSVRIQVGDGPVSSFGGVAYLREFEERTAFLGPVVLALEDTRDPARCRHRAADLLRFAVYARVLGFPDLADADLLRDDPLLRSTLAPGVQDQVGDPLAAKSTLHRFATETLTRRANRRALFEGLVQTGLQPVLASALRPRRVYVDVDSTEIEVHGKQEGSCNNGYFRAHCYHPVAVSLGDYGTTLGFLLRRGNAHTAQHATLFLLPILARVRRLLGPDVEIVVRGDSGFADPTLLAALEEHGYHYLIRMRENARLLGKAARIAGRKPGRPAKRRSAYRYLSFAYRAGSWPAKRRIVARAEFEPGTLFPDWTFVIAHLPRRTKRRRVVRQYLRRGRSEQAHDVFKNELHGDLMSHHRMVDNQVRGLLTALAQNLVVAFDHATRGRRRPRRPATVRARVLLVAATLVRHARTLTLRLAALAKNVGAFRRIAKTLDAIRPAARAPT